uniref:Uncharacterized protein n=1 Tax=viral metagenome TaxID=1070528 RepID=A0A6C0J7W9_9ZZZZ
MDTATEPINNYLIQSRLMCNPLLKHVHSNTIKRTLRRLVARNKIHDTLRLNGSPPSDVMTLYGQPLTSLPISYIFNIYHKNWWYWFDIRELMHYIRNNYDNIVNNPFNGLPFSAYQKYYISRAFYKASKTKGFELLDSGSSPTIPHKTTIELTASLIDAPYLQTGDINKLYGLVNQLCIYYNGAKTHYHKLNWIQYYYCQGNEEMFRYNICLFIMLLYESSTDQDRFKIMLSERYKHGMFIDPISVEGMSRNQIQYIPIFITALPVNPALSPDELPAQSEYILP